MVVGTGDRIDFHDDLAVLADALIVLFRVVRGGRLFEIHSFPVIAAVQNAAGRASRKENSGDRYPKMIRKTLAI